MKKMEKNLLYSQNLKSYFLDNNYNCLSPHNVGNNNDTIFLTAGIQPIIKEFLANKIINPKKIYISQPVIRTQFIDSINEGTSLAFVNSTTAGFNISEEDYNELIEDWLELFSFLGFESQNIQTKKKNYERLWGNLQVIGEKTFYYYNNLEIGDATFFTKVLNHGKNIGIDTMCDIGFGLERLRWCLDNTKSYFDLYSDSKNINCELKSFISALALLNCNEIKPSNKNIGYRFRLFAKQITKLLNGEDLDAMQKQYLNECLKYWKDWQEVFIKIDSSVIENELIRNGNRYILEDLEREGYNNLSGININISREELFKRLAFANVEKEKILKLKRRS